MLAILTVLVLVLSLTRRPGPEARTPAQLWHTIRPHGWRALLLALAGLAAVLALAAGGLVLATADVAVKALGVLAVVVTALRWHLADLIGYQPLREAR